MGQRYGKGGPPSWEVRLLSVQNGKKRRPFWQKRLLQQRFAVVGRRHSVHVLTQPLEGSQGETAVDSNGLDGVVGMLAKQLLGQPHTFLVQIVFQVLTATLLLYDAAEGGSVYTHQVGEHLTAEIALSVETTLFHGVVECGKTGRFGILRFRGGRQSLWLRHVSNDINDGLIFPFAYCLDPVNQQHDNQNGCYPAENDNPQAQTADLLRLQLVLIHRLQLLRVLLCLSGQQGVVDLV